MFGHDAWRPLTVAVLVSGAVFLPQGVASAAPADSLSCEQVRNSRVDPPRWSDSLFSRNAPGYRLDMKHFQTCTTASPDARSGPSPGVPPFG